EEFRDEVSAESRQHGLGRYSVPNENAGLVFVDEVMTQDSQLTTTPCISCLGHEDQDRARRSRLDHRGALRPHVRHPVVTERASLLGPREMLALGPPVEETWLKSLIARRGEGS